MRGGLLLWPAWAAVAPGGVNAIEALILLGVTKASLTASNFVFYAAEVREDRVHLQLGRLHILADPDRHLVSNLLLKTGLRGPVGGLYICHVAANFA